MISGARSRRVYRAFLIGRNYKVREVLAGACGKSVSKRRNDAYGTVAVAYRRRRGPKLAEILRFYR